MPKPLTDEQILERIEMSKTHSHNEMARMLGIGQSNITRSLRSQRALELQETLDQGYPIKGRSTLYDADGVKKLEWVKTEKLKEDILETANQIVEGLRAEIPVYKRVKKPKIIANDKRFMNTVVFGDGHLNMRAWAREVGRDWDLKIATERHMGAMLDMIENQRPAALGRFVSLGDLLHNDSLRPQTFNHTDVDVDSRMSMAIDEAVKFCRASINLMLEKYLQVDVVLVRGNHSATMELALGKMLAIAYEKEPRVNVVDNTPDHIPLIWEKNFQLFTHGKMTHQKKVDVAVSHFRDLHGAAKFTHVLSGHLHHHDSKELGGCLSEIFQVLPTADSYHFSNGFVTADQSACLLRYHKNGGIVDRHFANPRIYMGDK